MLIKKFHLKAWTTATDRVFAPAPDLAILQKLTAIKQQDSGVSKAASKKLASHIWYLSEEPVGLSLLDVTVFYDMGTKIVQKMSEERLENLPKRAVFDLKHIQNKILDELETVNTLILFNPLGLSKKFLGDKPSILGRS